ncbi:unannotated protein [freshwater metagenome]|uniref:Unannotated protein n=1 Tax=freshwater metagenome TaxID=449393 RepID=A0A6J7LFF6_9ZZZZ
MAPGEGYNRFPQIGVGGWLISPDRSNTRKRTCEVRVASACIEVDSSGHEPQRTTIKHPVILCGVRCRFFRNNKLARFRSCPVLIEFLQLGIHGKVPLQVTDKSITLRTRNGILPIHTRVYRSPRPARRGVLEDNFRVAFTFNVEDGSTTDADVTDLARCARRGAFLHPRGKSIGVRSSTRCSGLDLPTAPCDRRHEKYCDERDPTGSDPARVAHPPC